MSISEPSPARRYTDAEAYQQALALLYACSTEHGFVATPTENVNYRRVWSRDGVIIGLAALLSDDQALITSMRNTLNTLAKYQGPHGEIPSNVDPVSQRVSYGGTTGRVDANMWFIIGCGEYWRHTGDNDFITEHLDALEKARFLLGAWEFNNRGLIYVPQAGDWADEYIHSGYILYDQLLYLQSLRTFRHIHKHIHGSEDHSILEQIARLKHLISANYWFNNHDTLPDDVYHETLYKKGHAAAPHCHDMYWMPYFSPAGYGYRFDAFANVLASLFRVATEHQQEAVDTYITNLLSNDLPLLPAFNPVIEPVSQDWEDLQITFSYTFRNKPYEYHNGGLWSMLTGFYVADLAARNKMSQAQHFLEGINTANAMPIDDTPWSFAEFIHGKNLTPGGNQFQGWSAAAAIIGSEAIAGKPLFRIDAE